MRSSRSSSIFWGLLLVLVGILIFLNNSDILYFENLISEYWPLLIVLFGIYLIVKSSGHRERPQNWDFADRHVISDSEHVIQSNTFGDIKVAIESKNFQSGEIRTTFGDVKVDATKLEIPEGERKLILCATFGDIKVDTPKSLPIKVTANLLAGDMNVFDQKRGGFNQHMKYQSDGYEMANAKLYIICSLTFGDVKVW